MAPIQRSTFLDPDNLASPTDLSILHLRRDNLVPTLLSLDDEKNVGYAEGKVTNTRFGSFPHSTLIGKHWGSQVRASAVDTGSRGRIPNVKKRKRGSEGASKAAGENGDEEIEEVEHKDATEASSGFVHLLTPTPERWTTSLPHRTQVVYTPDYSYILHRISARAGTRLIEAGAGSGSFTHAAVRAVFNEHSPAFKGSQTTGKVFSYEFHIPRYEKMITEIEEHGLSDLVEVTSRDVCKDGFAPSTTSAHDVQATAVFLDLPAPWLALPHLSHSTSTSVLSRTQTVKICTFSPCIEQVQRTVTELRKSGWVEIHTEELGARRIEVRRDRVGGQTGGGRGGNDGPADVMESLVRLRGVERRSRGYMMKDDNQAESPEANDLIKDSDATAKETALWNQGRLVTRNESELKTHTSYLTFAVLPRPWSDADELNARLLYSSSETPPAVEDGERKLGKKAKKRLAKVAREASSKQEMNTEAMEVS